MKAFFRGNKSKLGAATLDRTATRPDPRRRLIRVHAGRYRMTVVGLNGGRAAGKSRQRDDGPENGEQDGSHRFIWFSFSIRKRACKWASAANRVVILSGAKDLTNLPSAPDYP